jgi:hypothetical protein
MPHVMVWLIVLAGAAGPVQIVVQSEPFATKEACEAWDKVPLTVRANAQVVSSESACMAVERREPTRERRRDT